MQKLLVYFSAFIIFATAHAQQNNAAKLKDIDDEVQMGLYCFGKSSELCKHFKTFTSIDLIEHEGISLDESNVIIAIRNETLQALLPKVKKSNDLSLSIMSVLLKEPFIKFLKLNVAATEGLILAIRNAQGKTIRAVRFNYSKIIKVDPASIVKSVNLALIYGNDRFYQKLIIPTLEYY